MDKITAMIISGGLGLITGYEFGTKSRTVVVAIGMGMIFVAGAIRLWLIVHGNHLNPVPPAPGKGTHE